MSLAQLVKRPELGLDEVLSMAKVPTSPELDEDTLETLEIEIKYAGYIAIQKQEIERLRKMSDVVIPDSLEYAGVAVFLPRRVRNL